MRKNAAYFVGMASVTLLAAALLFYGYFQSREFLLGPRLYVLEPKNGSVVGEPAVTISGTARNVSRISLNDNQIFTDRNGVFREKLLLLPGYNILTLKAEDRFGKKTKKILELDYNPPTKEVVASSTPL